MDVAALHAAHLFWPHTRLNHQRRHVAQGLARGHQIAPLLVLAPAVYLRALNEVDTPAAVWRYQAIEQALKICLEDYPKIYEYVYQDTDDIYFEPSVDNDEIIRQDRAKARYEDFRESRLKLHSLAQLNTAVFEKESEGKNSEFEYDPEWLSTKKFKSTVTLVKDRDGLIDWVEDFFTSATRGAELERIRLCANRNCRRVFYVGRTNMVCCSRSCDHALRNQRYRARYRDPKDSYKMRKLDSKEKSSKKKTVRFLRPTRTNRLR